MLAIERRDRILQQLQKDKRVLVSELSALFSVSEETIRRDLEKLEQDGYVIKTYGGAVLNEDNHVDLPFVIRKNTNVSEKQTIGRLLAELISDGDHIMLDSSSTAVFVAKYIKNKKNITLITNSIEILIELSDVSGWNIISTGGSVKQGTLSLVGPQVEQTYGMYNVDLAVISCKGVDITSGVTDSNGINAFIKQKIFSRSKKRVLAVDHTKFSKVALIEICTLNALTHVVTDKNPGEHWLAEFERLGIQCVFPK
ncbi:MAG: DeoR/GlpR transcriptional regulator [Clostridia bacterium]|nr:DeoR/GlpR transcriptional regulator [Clostridia bacterium]